MDLKELYSKKGEIITVVERLQRDIQTLVKTLESLNLEIDRINSENVKVALPRSEQDSSPK